MKLFDFLESGNGYKCRLLLAQLDIPYERINLDILKGETRTPEFLAVNPNGRIPALVLDDGTVIAESNAILFYLAEGTPCLPDDRLARAHVLQWMFFEQYSHEPYIAVARFWRHLQAMSDEQKAQLPDKMQRGHAALGVMDGHLRGNDYFVGSSYTIADIALYAYTHVADEGGFELTNYPAIRAWLGRVAAEPGHIPITQG